MISGNRLYAEARIKKPQIKSDRQLRAELLARKFREDARRTIVLEFAGVPKAGKTSTIAQAQTFLKRCGFSVKVVIERASVCPIKDKKHSNFNVWTACTTLAQLLEHTQDPPRADDPQILILDRGLFDAICWFRMMDRLSRIRTEDRLAIEQFLLSQEWLSKISGVIVMTVSPEDSLKREQGLLPVVQATGSIMNHDVLDQMLKTTRETFEDLRGRMPLIEVNTSEAPNNQAAAAAGTVVDHILEQIETHLSENILSIPKEQITAAFEGRALIGPEGARRLLSAFQAQGDFAPRKNVEENPDKIQALPAVIVRNKTGDVLRLTRRERESSNPLHEKRVIWAGGHVRVEDKSNGDAVLHGALRELNEELRLNVEPEELRLLGAVYVDQGNKASISKHVAIVYEWRADTDDVAITLSTAEFFERRGTSLSGRFVSVKDLIKEAELDKVEEPWSHHILGKMLSNAGEFRLFY